MPGYYTTIGPWTFQTFSFVITLAALAGTGVGLWHARRKGYAAALADVYLGGLAGGIVVARLFHVLLNWDYFGENLQEATQITLGGLDWHGAVIGGLAGMGIVYYLRKWLMRKINLANVSSPLPPFPELLNAFAPVLALLGIIGWYACLAGLCGYGREVQTLAEYPAWVAAETADVFGINAPRFNTQLFGILWSLVVLMIALVRPRFGWTLALLSLGYFLIGFFRGDHALFRAALRLDQWLDLVLLGAVVVVSVSKKLFSVYFSRSKRVIP